MKGAGDDGSGSIDRRVVQAMNQDAVEGVMDDTSDDTVETCFSRLSRCAHSRRTKTVFNASV